VNLFICINGDRMAREGLNLLQEPTFNERAGKPNNQRGAFIPRIKSSNFKSRRGSPVAKRGGGY